MPEQEQKRRRSYLIDMDEPFKLLMPGYPESSNLTILNTAYIGRRKTEEGSITKDFIFILYKDCDTGAKKTEIIYEPLYTFYQLKPEYQVPDHNLAFIDKDKVVPRTCKYADLLRAIAEVTDNVQQFMQNIADQCPQENKKLHAEPDIFLSDMNIENYYRFLFNLSYKNEPFKLSKGFMDIETDIRYSHGEFPEPGEVPINAIAYCDEVNNVVYQFLLNDPRNPLVEQYKQEFSRTNLLEQLKDFVIKAVGGYKKAVKFGVDKLKYKIVFFDDEIELITKMFQVVKATAPDFIEFWNMAFDFDYIIARLDNLGVDPVSVICDSRVSQSFLKFYIDERNKNEYAERGDFAALSSYTVFIDQMIQFASRRKGRGRYPSFKLDSIGETVAGVKKLDYSHITNSIGELPYLDFKTFSFYNVMDVIVQKCIEVSTQDLEYVFTKCIANNTVYPKAHRQSVYLANRFAKDYYDYGYIIGNNKNFWNEKPSTKFPGAMVGDPLHNDEGIMVYINGRPTLLCNNDVDFDYSSLYPSIILENNLAPNTQVGRIIIEDPKDPKKSFGLCEHPDMYSSDDNDAKYSRGGEFLENLMCGNPLEFGRRWLGLGDVYQVIEDLREFYKFNKYSGKPIDFTIRDAIYYTKDKSIKAVEFYDKYMAPTMITFENALDTQYKEELIEKIKVGALL